MTDKINPLYFELFPRKPTKGDKRKALILDKTIEILAKAGVDEVNLDIISSKLRIRRSHVAYYFKNKEDLLYHCMLMVIKTGQAAVVDYLRSCDSEKHLLATYVKANFYFIEKHPNEARVYLLGIYKSSIDRKWRDLFLTIQDGGANRLSSIISDLRTDLNARELRNLALEVHDLITMHFFFYLAYDPGESIRKYEIRVIELVAQLLRLKS